MVFQGFTEATVEHLMQVIETLDPDQRAAVLAAAIPREAKILGRKVTLRPGWGNMRVHVVIAVIFIKFLQPDLRQALLTTGDAVLVEDDT
ncbi:NADAR domain-containing protein [Corynebacterium glutamicum]|uniref:NADAR domain-containing protein n=1 Tax=Corynebacterium glutamicum TaxID=1718 RepID=UPI001E60D0FE|nr:NADAR domain-containing protein [Corynebacterium glutamicum]WBG76144.1 NADAR domain-containing protein [Corynebacterium glutamicum]